MRADPNPNPAVAEPASVVTVAELSLEGLRSLLDDYGLTLTLLADGAEIPGSHWGAPEAGIIGREVLVRPDTPVHSLLHEAAHVICMDAQRRDHLHTDAGGDDLEECGVCYLQLLLGDELVDYSLAQQFRDMDCWGYSYRLGSAQDWFEQDADDARQWLRAQQLIDAQGRPQRRLR